MSEEHCDHSTYARDDSVHEPGRAKRVVYIDALGFKVKEDVTNAGYRWLSVAPQDQNQVAIVLGLAMDSGQKALIGKQGAWVLESDDIQADHARLEGQRRSRSSTSRGRSRGVPSSCSRTSTGISSNWFKGRAVSAVPA